MLQYIQGFIQLESSYGCGEQGNKNITPCIRSPCAFFFDCSDFQDVFTIYIDAFDNDGIIVDQLFPIFYFLQCAGGGFIVTLAKFAPETVQHNLRHCFSTWIDLNLVFVQLNTFMLSILCHILGFLLVGHAIGGPATGFLFGLQKLVDVGSKQSCLSLTLSPMPHLMNLQNSVAFLDSHFKFLSTPSTCHFPLLITMFTKISSLVPWLVQLLPSTCSTQSKHTLVINFHRQYGVK